MSVIYSPTLRTVRMQAVLNAISGGIVRIGTEDMAIILANIPLVVPAGILEGDTIILTAPQSDNSAPNEGVAVEAQILNNVGEVEVSGLSVGVDSGNVIIDDEVILVGQIVTMYTGLLKHNTSG